MMPELQNILLGQLQPSGPVLEGIEVGQFVTMRQVTGHQPSYSRYPQGKKLRG
jgi:hypothetical protein